MVCPMDPLIGEPTLFNVAVRIQRGRKHTGIHKLEIEHESPGPKLNVLSTPYRTMPLLLP